ncbi:MAG: signal peptide peptidase SppA [Nitratireductor sp.]|nr:signal peptide peptidase SppA [Nitratireductor sp.]
MAIQGSELSPAQIIDRRRMKRRITTWRVLSLVFLACAILAVLWALDAFEGLGEHNSDHIARVRISGVITNDKPMLDLLEELAEEDHVKAVILDISSPGGSTVGGEAIYEAVRALAQEKPVATAVGTLAASAGYMIASATDHIVARRSSIVGSIGVLFQFANATELLEKIGVTMEEIKSSPLKAEPSPFNRTTEEERAMIDKLIQDSYQWFVGLVSERRGLSRADTLKLADGSIFTGAQGLENGLVDAIGDEKTAQRWLEEEREVEADLEILTWKPKRPGDSLLENPAGRIAAAARWLAGALGLPLPAAGGEELRRILPERLFLDGLVSMLQIEAVDETGAD